MAIENLFLQLFYIFRAFCYCLKYVPGINVLQLEFISKLTLELN